MDSDAEKGLQAWLTWCGLSDGPATLAAWRLRFADETATLRALGELLYQPPSENDRGTRGQEPEADILLERLSKQSGAAAKPFWPSHAPYAVCITHDIDRIFATYQRLRGFWSSPVQSLEHTAHDLWTALLADKYRDNPFYNFQSLLDLERSWGVTSASYVLFEHPRFWRALFKGEIQHLVGAYEATKMLPHLKSFETAGHEIGIHGSFDSWNDPKLLGRERREVQRQGFRIPEGIRNHYLQFDSKTAAHQLKAGFSYDSSMGFNYRPGFRCGTAFPFQMNGMIEIPLLLMDTALRYSYASHSERQQAAFRVLDQVRRHHGVLMLDWHFHLMSKTYFPDWVDLLESLIKEGRKDGAWFALPREIAVHWNGRANSNFINAEKS